MEKILSYYSEVDIAKLLCINPKAVREKIKRDKEFENHYFIDDNKYFVKKILINEILDNRKISVSTVEASKILGRDYSTILRMVKDKRIKGYKDKWEKVNRIFNSSIEEYIMCSTKFYTIKELSNIFNINENNIRKKIHLNYSNIQKYLYRSEEGYMLIKKDAISYLNNIEKNYTSIEIIAKNNDIKQTELLRRIELIKEDIIIKNFFDGKTMVNNNYIDYILNTKDLIENSMYLDHYILIEKLTQNLLIDLKTILEFLNNNLKEEFYKSIKKSLGKDAIPQELYNKIIKYISNIIIDKNNNIYSEQLITLKDAADLFGISEKTMFRRLWENIYNFNNYIEIKQSKKYLKMKYFDNVRENILNSKLTIDLAKELNITNKLLEENIIKLNKSLLIPDFFMSANRILKKHILEVKNYIISNKEFDENKYIKLSLISLEFKLTQSDIRRIIEDKYKDKSNDILKRNNNVYYIKKEFVEDIKSFFNNYLEDTGLVPENYEILNGKLKIYDINRTELRDIIKYKTNFNYDDIIIKINKDLYISNEKWNSILHYIDDYYNCKFIYFDNLIHVRKASKILSIKLSELKIYSKDLFNINIDKNIIKNNSSFYFNKNFYENLENLFNVFFENRYFKLNEFLDDLNITKFFFFEILDDKKIEYRIHIKKYKSIEYINKEFSKEISESIKKYQKYKFDPYLNYIYVKHVLELFGQNIYDLSNLFKGEFHTDISNIIKTYNGFEIIPINYYISMKKNKKKFLNKNFYREDYYLLTTLTNNNNIRLNRIKEICEEKNINFDKEIYFYENKKLVSKNLYNVVLKIVENKQKSKIIKFIDNRIYTISDEVTKKLNISEYIINTLLNEDIEGNFVIYMDKIYIKNTYINFMNNYFDNHIKLKDIAKQKNTSVRVLKKACIKENIELYNNIFSVTDLLIKKEDRDRLISSKTVEKSIKKVETMELTKLANNEYELFNTLIKDSKVNYSKTKELFIKFFYNKLSDSDTKQSERFGMARRYSNLYQYLNNILDTEIFNITDSKISNIFSSLDTKNNTKMFIEFLNYCKMNIECKFTTDYSIYNERKSGYTDIYTVDEWIQITEYLIDIDKHLQNSLESQKYSNYWLLGLLHLILTFRINDYITKMPNLYIEEIGIDNFGWFKNENIFTLEMAQKLINQIKINLEGNEADKNDQPLRFYYNIDFILPITIAYTICELHRRKNKDKNIFQVMISDKYDDIEISPAGIQGFNRFFELNDIPIISNTKASSTLITQVYNYTNDKEGLKHVALLIGSSQRSHKIDKDILIPRSTSIYIKPIYNQEDVKDIAINIQKRGFFGWIPYKILQIIDKGDNFNNKQLFEVTNEILELKNKLTLIGMENLCGYINDEFVNKKTENLFKELMNMRREDIKIKLIDAIRYSSAAKDGKCGCLAGPICKEKNTDKCFRCVYSLKNIYMLYELEKDIHEIIDKIERCKLDDINERIKYSHLFKNDMLIISEAKLFYDEYDQDFIKAFIDIKKLKERANKIKEKLIL